MCMFGRDRKIAVDGRGKRMNELRPLRTEKPQGTTAMPAKMTLRSAGVPAVACSRQHRVIHRDLVGAAHLHGSGISRQIDGVAAPALRFSDRKRTRLNSSH